MKKLSNTEAFHILRIKLQDTLLSNLKMIHIGVSVGTALFRFLKKSIHFVRQVSGERNKKFLS